MVLKKISGKAAAFHTYDTLGRAKSQSHLKEQPEFERGECMNLYKKNS